MKLPVEILQRIKLEYHREYVSALKRIQDLKKVLDELKDIPMPDSVLDIQETVSKEPEQTYTAEQETAKKETTVLSTESQEAENTPTLKATPVKKRRMTPKSTEKRGRKSIWGKFIVTRLKSVQRPLTLDDLANHAIVTMKLDPANFSKIRQSIVNAVFGLRQKEKIVTVGVKGTREKVVSLPQWLDEREKLLPEYQVS